MIKREVVIAPAGGFESLSVAAGPSESISIQVADANAQPGRNAHFALDVIALDPNA
jgi:hypothetical protein